MNDDDIPALRAPSPTQSPTQFTAAVMARVPPTRSMRWWVPVAATAGAVVVVLGRIAQPDVVELAATDAVEVDDWASDSLTDLNDSQPVFAFAELDGSSDGELNNVELRIDRALAQHRRSKT
jgi:hypothetical protein